MNNEPVAHFYPEGVGCTVYDIKFAWKVTGTKEPIPLYEKEAIDRAFEAGRQQGMQQERALWELSASTQEIEATMSEKGYKVGNLEDIPDRHLTWEDAPFQVPAPKELADEIDKALGIKR